MTDLEQSGIIEAPRRHVSFSQMSSYMDCGVKYQLKYMEPKAPTEAAGPLIGGIAVHRAVEISEREGWWQDDHAFEAPIGGDQVAVGTEFFKELMSAAVDEAGGEGAVRWGGRGGVEDYRWWIANGEFMLRRYQQVRRNMVEGGWGVVEDGVEMRVEATLPGMDRAILGYLDKFVMHEGGEPMIVDYKTGRVGNLNPWQFATYAAMLKVARGLDVTRGVGVFLRSPDADKQVQPVYFSELVPRVTAMFQGFVAGVDAGFFNANANAWHATCEVRDSCWYWKAIQPPA